MVDSESKKLMIKRDRRNRSRILLYGILFSVLLFFLNLVKPTVIDLLHYRFYDSCCPQTRENPLLFLSLLTSMKKASTNTGNGPGHAIG